MVTEIVTLFRVLALVFLKSATPPPRFLFLIKFLLGQEHRELNSLRPIIEYGLGLDYIVKVSENVGVEGHGD
jgi:hypothetical protein